MFELNLYYLVMELIKFKGTIYGKVKTQFFVWEPSWESFRPIEKIAWNGKAIVAVDGIYKDDIFDPFYGYGSAEMKHLCKVLTENTDLGVSESDTMPWIAGEWWRDRQCSFANECTSRTPASWNRYIKYMNSKSKTLRNHRETRATKRLLPK
jgi:hypothetical protein